MRLTSSETASTATKAICATNSADDLLAEGQDPTAASLANNDRATHANVRACRLRCTMVHGHGAAGV